MIGAVFTRMSTEKEGFYTGPALLALSLALLDIIVIVVTLRETLPTEKRVGFY